MEALLEFCQFHHIRDQLDLDRVVGRYCRQHFSSWHPLVETILLGKHLHLNLIDFIPFFTLYSLKAIL